MVLSVDTKRANVDALVAFFEARGLQPRTSIYYNAERNECCAIGALSLFYGFEPGPDDEYGDLMFGFLEERQFDSAYLSGFESGFMFNRGTDAKLRKLPEYNAGVDDGIALWNSLLDLIDRGQS